MQISALLPYFTLEIYSDHKLQDSGDKVLNRQSNHRTDG